VPWVALTAVSLMLVAVVGVGAAVGALTARHVPDDDLLRGTS
jgi:hypothetical protein